MNTLVPIEDVARHFSVSLSTVRKWIRDGLIPDNMYVKVGHTQRFALERVADALMRYDEKKKPESLDLDDDV